MKETSISIPDGITVSYENSVLTVRGPKGELSRPVSKKLSVTVSPKTIVLAADDRRRKNVAVLYTWRAHLKNMFIGVTAGWVAQMKIIYLHFPIKFSVEGKKILIGNFLGERAPREARLLDGVTVKLDKDTVTVTGIDKENVGNQCGAIESTTVIRNRDRRVFSDGIWLVQPPTAGKNN